MLRWTNLHALSTCTSNGPTMSSASIWYIAFRSVPRYATAWMNAFGKWSSGCSHAMRIPLIVGCSFWLSSTATSFIFKRKSLSSVGERGVLKRFHNSGFKQSVVAVSTMLSSKRISLDWLRCWNRRARTSGDIWRLELPNRCRYPPGLWWTKRLLGMSMRITGFFLPEVLDR